MKYDVMVVGSGIAGMESSIKLGDMGYKVLLVEKEASVGGRMILLSKVFPTLDCASCISGPKMSSTINHPNITTMAYSEVLGIHREADGHFNATIKNKARFIDWAACTGCKDCQDACTVAIPDPFNANLVPMHAAYIAFPQAVPKKAVITRVGTSPCIDSCPAGIKAHGYVSLIRSGKFEEAFQLVLDATPLVGTLGRACYAPCESDCTRTSLEGPIPIRRLKRFAADAHYADADGPGVEVAEPNGHSVAIVGSGPAGLTAAWQLARGGYKVTIFEAAAEPGGFLRHAIPAYRLPREVVAQDISNVTAIGVEIVTNHPVRDLEALKDEGFDAVLVATGTPRPMGLGVPGEDAEGVMTGLTFLRNVSLGEIPDLTGKTVVVVGGGNVAMDAARTARRLGTVAARVAYRRGRDEMPAHAAEIDEAEMEGVAFDYLVAPIEVVKDAAGAVSGLRCQRMALGQADDSGRRRPEPIPGSEFVLRVPGGRGGHRHGARRHALREHHRGRSWPPDQGGPDHAAERPPVPLRLRRRGAGRQRHHPGHRPRPPRRVHDRQVDQRPARLRASRSSTTRWASWPRPRCSHARPTTPTARRSGPTPSTPQRPPTSPRSSPR